MDTVIKATGVKKTYPNGVKALKGVDFEVKKGEFLVVIGLSGSGKSTLLRCVNKLHEITDGKLEVLGRSVSDLDISGSRDLRKDVGFVFQHFNLIPRKSVLVNVLSGALGRTSTWRSLLGLHSKKDIEDAMRYLEIVGLKGKENSRADQLSGGQQQRVAIARALMQKPKIILADEPVASLDPATSHSVMDYLKKVNEELGVTVIANLHFLSLVRQYASRVLALADGEVVFEGTPQEIDEAWFTRIYGEGTKEVTIH